MGSGARGVATGAAGGAALGSTILPGWGTAIGAGVGALGGGIAALISDKDTEEEKRKWIADQRARALHELNQRRMAQLGYPAGGGGAYAANQINKEADQRFASEPMSFVPFVQNATRVAGSLYGAAKNGEQPAERLAPDDIARAQQAAQAQRDELERAQAMQHFQGVYGDDNSWRY